MGRSVAIALFSLCHSISSVAVALSLTSIPPFAFKLIVVESDRELLLANSTEFRSKLNEITSDHISRSLTLSLITPVNVTSTIEEFKYTLIVNDGGKEDGILLAVVFAGFRGIAQYDGPEVDMVPLVLTALSQDTGFWDLAKAMVNNDVLKEVAKLQIAVDNRIVAEGNLVPEQNESDEDDSEENIPDSSQTALIVVATICAVVVVGIVICCVMFCKYRHEQFLERKKVERRQMAKKRRMMDYDRSSSYSSGFSLHGSSGSGLKKSPNKHRKKPVVSKPSKEAMKEKKLIRIIEQSEEEGSDEKEDEKYVFEGSESIVSFQSCQSSLTSLSGSPKKLAKGWNELEIPDYLRNSRGFHTGSFPQLRTDSPAPANKKIGQPMQQKVGAPTTWELHPSPQNGPFTTVKPDQKCNASDPIKVVENAATSKTINSTIVRRITPATNLQPTPVQEANNTGNECMANCDVSQSTSMTNQFSLSSSTSSNCNQVGETFLNSPVLKTDQKVRVALNSRSPRYDDEVTVNFNMSMANFDLMDDSDLFEDSQQESMTFDEFSQDLSVGRPGEQLVANSSLQRSNDSDITRSTSKRTAASWRFT